MDCERRSAIKLSSLFHVTLKGLQNVQTIMQNFFVSCGPNLLIQGVVEIRLNILIYKYSQYLVLTVSNDTQRLPIDLFVLNNVLVQDIHRVNRNVWTSMCVVATFGSMRCKKLVFFFLAYLVPFSLHRIVQLAFGCCQVDKFDQSLGVHPSIWNLGAETSH